MGLSLSFQVSFFVAALSASFNKSFLLIASPSFSFQLVRFRCGSFPVVPRLFFFVAALSSSFNKSFLLIASPSFSLELVRFRCGSFPVVPSLFFSLRRCPPLLKVIPLNCFSFLFVGTRAFSLWVFPCRSKTLFFVAALSASFNKSFLLIASAFSFQLVRFRCGSFPVVPSLFFFRCRVVLFF